MAFTDWILNQIPTAAKSMYLFKEMLVGAGWTVLSSGTGTSGTYNSSGDSITDTTFNTSRSWFIISNGTSQLCVQRGSSGGQYFWIKYSPSDGFIGGTPDAQTVPTATDEVNIYATNSSGSQLFWTDNQYILQGGAADASDGYAFWMVAYAPGTLTTYTAVVMEPMQSVDSLDTDPGKQNVFYVRYNQFGGLFSGNWLFSSGFPPIGYLGSSFTDIHANYYRYYYFNNLSPIPGANSQYSGEDFRIPIIYAKRSSYAGTTGYKGIGKNMMYEFTGRSTGSTKGAKTRIFFEVISFPWDGTTNPLV